MKATSTTSSTKAARRAQSKPKAPQDKTDKLRSAVKEAISKERNEVEVFKLTQKQHSLTEEAYAWYKNEESIPGTGSLSPSRFVCQATIDEYFEALGHKLDLDEIKLLIQPDGAAQTCIIDEVPFQPVLYVPYHMPKDVKQAIKGGKKLSEIKLMYLGAFFQIDDVNGGEKFAASGCPYNPRGIEQRSTPLFVIALLNGLASKKSKEPFWGETQEHIDTRIATRLQNRETADRRWDKGRELFKDALDRARTNNGRGFRNEPAFSMLKLKKRRN